jgi:RNA polymerase sigma-70 factor (ECF subfamily)
LSEDVLQETYVKVWRNAAIYDPALARPVSWMAAIARNSAIDQIRRKAEPRPAADDAELQAMLNAAERTGAPDFAEIETLRRCLAGLESEHRRCILLAYYDGFSREELAAEFDRPVGTIKTWLHRGLASLKACMEAT